MVTGPKCFEFWQSDRSSRLALAWRGTTSCCTQSCGSVPFRMYDTVMSLLWTRKAVASAKRLYPHATRDAPLAHLGRGLTRVKNRSGREWASLDEGMGMPVAVVAVEGGGSSEQEKRKVMKAALEMLREIQTPCGWKADVNDQSVGGWK